jgi:hypothetical protein
VVVLPKRIQALLDAIQPWDSPREHTDEWLIIVID